MSDASILSPVMRANIEPRIEEMRRDYGQLAGYLRDTQAGLMFNGKVWENKIQIASNESFHHRWDGEPIGNPTNEEYITAQWLPKYGYAVAEWSNNIDLLSTDPNTSLVRLSTERVTKAIFNSMNRINQVIWGNGAGELAFISVAQDDYVAPTLHFRATGTLVPSVGGKAATATAQYHRFSNIWLKKGMRVDLISGTTHVPRVGGTNMLVTYVGKSIGDDAAVNVSVTGPTAKITGLAIGDYFVTHDDIDDGSTGGTAGASKAAFGMLAFAGSGNPGGTVVPRYAGNIDSVAYPDWDSGSYQDAAETNANLSPMTASAILSIQKYGGDPDTLICHPGVESAWWTAFKSTIFHTNTLTVEGGYEGCYIVVGGKRLFFTGDWGCPRGTLFVFPRNALKYAVRKAFYLADEDNMLAVSKIDKTSAVFKEIYNLVCVQRQYLSMVINIV